MPPRSSCSALLVIATLAGCPTAPGESSDVEVETEREVDELPELPTSVETEVTDPDTDVTEGDDGDGTGVACPDTCADDCDDGNPCTDAVCECGVCRYVPNVLSCDDGEACTVDDRCLGGACVGSPMACDDRNACTDDACEAGTCVHRPASGGCDDADACTVFDTCVDGACIGEPRTCPTRTCATTTCEPRTGCALVPTVPSGGPCDDGNACTTDDTCRADTCAGTLVSCDDDNPCTDDYCDPAAGCVHRDNAAICDDGDSCTGPDRCNLGTCVSGGDRCCDDDNDCPNNDACTATSCIDGGCIAEPTCVDDDPCTLDRCTAGACAFPTWQTLLPFVNGRSIVDDFEAGVSAWTFASDNPVVAWHLSTTWSAAGTTGGAHSLYLADPTTGTYDHGPVNAVASREQVLPPGPFTLTMAVRSDFEDDGSCLYDALEVTLVPVSPPGEPITLGKICTSGQGVQSFAIDTQAGGLFRLELTFDTVDELRNDGAGVWVDDLVLEGSAPACP